jgi:hypothetical protein
MAEHSAPMNKFRSFGDKLLATIAVLQSVVARCHNSRKDGA